MSQHAMKSWQHKLGGPCDISQGKGLQVPACHIAGALSGPFDPLPVVELLTPETGGLLDLLLGVEPQHPACCIIIEVALVRCMILGHKSQHDV